MEQVSQDVLKRLEETENEDEWNAICDEVKADGGYPVDWFTKVIKSGLCARVQARWKQGRGP